jgi:hypothetical protein
MGVVSTVAGFSNLTSIGDATVSLAAATKAIIKPDDKIEGIDGLVFDIPESESLALKAQITDHFVEDNTALQDHIAISPISVTLSGKVAEVVMEQSKLQQYAQSILTTLGSLSAIAPTLSQSAASVLKKTLQAKAAADAVVARYKNAASLFDDKATASKQKRYYQKIKGMFDSRGVFTVQTPWVTLSNMAIEAVNFEQDESTKDWSTVSVTLKQIQFAKTKTVTGKLKGRIVQQKAPLADKGKNIGKSLAKQGFEKLKEVVSTTFGA